jgi:transcriptional regulator with XRE-family HTH domain
LPAHDLNEVSLLEQLRHDKGVSIGEVVAATGVMHKTIVRYERDPMYYPNPGSLRKLADYYGVTASALLVDMRRRVRLADGVEPVHGERYARCIVYVRWVPGDQLRPVESYDELAGAINRSDELAAGGRGPTDVKVIDVENLELGDMRVAEACAEMVARIRAESPNNPRTSEPPQPPS